MNKFIFDIKKFYHYVIYSARSELKEEVANSYLNWVWWILEPLCFMGVYAVIFGLFFNSKEDYFTAFIFLGIALWDFFNRSLHASVKLVKNNKSIVSKVYVPKYILVMKKMGVYAFKMMVCLGIEVLLMIVYRIPVSLKVLWMIPILAVLMLFTFGSCCIVMHFGVYIEDLSNVINILTRLLFYLTGIFYNISKKAPGNWGRILSKGNPMAFLLDSARRVLLYDTAFSWKWLLLWCVVSLGLCVFGVRLIQKNENSYVKVI